MDPAHSALLDLLKALAARDYRFVTPTNVAIRRIHRRPRPAEPTLEDVLGWSLPFDPHRIEPEILALMERAQVLEPDGKLMRSTVRVSWVAGALYLHSAFPTHAADAVFLGPDSWRFVRFIGEAVKGWRAPKGVLVDIGAGPGVGGLSAVRLCPKLALVLTDVNAKALDMARINAAFAGAACDLRLGEGLAKVDEPIALAVANPPFIAGKPGQHYQDGGEDLHGGAVALDWARQAMERLVPGGRFVLYTGAAVVRGRDEFKAALADAVERAGFALTYEELDPDIFTGVLRGDAYSDVERLAAVGAVVERPA